MSGPFSCCEVTLSTLTYFGVPDPLVTRCQKYTVHNRELASLFWFVVPPSCDHIPYGVLQPLLPTHTCWAGWPRTAFDIIADPVLVTDVMWQHTRKDLIVGGELYQGEWFTPKERTVNEVIARE